MSIHYETLKKNLAKGWNTWNTQSVTSHVLLPLGFGINLGFKEYRGGSCLKTPLIGRQAKEEEKIHPGPHAYNGSYTSLSMKWSDIDFTVESAHDGNDVVILISAANNPGVKPPSLIIEPALLWNRPGIFYCKDETLICEMPDTTITVYITTPTINDLWSLSTTPYLMTSIAPATAVCTGKKRTRDEIRSIIKRERDAFVKKADAYGECAEIYRAIQTCMAWDTIYEPTKDRVVSPVSRLWNVGSGGYVLFCWDNYFAGYLAGIDCKELAYANVIEITHEKAPAGFVPNYANGAGFFSEDRSQPPVGSAMVKELYRRFGDRWLLEELFDDLLGWNRWWPEHRDTSGLLCWGSDPFPPRVGNYWEITGVNDRFGAALESGLDNSPMYDDMPFDKECHQLKLADAGLMGLYIMDCEALADIARVLGKKAEQEELLKRAKAYRSSCEKLWDDTFGLYCNRRTDTQEFSHRIAPTNFYPLIGRVPDQKQAERMINEHLLNPKEFWGDWIMPSIARNDPAYPDQSYWRGRIWAPMNFLVYLGLRNYKLDSVRKEFAKKSGDVLLKEWLAFGHVHENYNGDTGEGCDKPNSDRFYHWGGLLGMIALIEHGHVAAPENPLP